MENRTQGASLSAKWS